MYKAAYITIRRQKLGADFPGVNYRIYPVLTRRSVPGIIGTSVLRLYIILKNQGGIL